MLVYLCDLLVLLEGLAGLLCEPPVPEHAQVSHTGRGQAGRHNLFEDLCKYSECQTLRRQCRVCNLISSGSLYFTLTVGDLCCHLVLGDHQVIGDFPSLGLGNHDVHWDV